MAIASNPGPFNGETNYKQNRIRRITFCIGSVKTASHVVNPTGSRSRYDRARDDSSDPGNIQTTERNTYITEEA
jgi:hypothetical protein